MNRNFDLDDAQKDALYVLMHERCGIVTGPPGSGKTSVLLTMLTLLPTNKLQVVLLAPTGRAARRMAEVTGYPASTIHRYAIANASDPAPDIVVIDESSMLSIDTFTLLLNVLKQQCSGDGVPFETKCRIILLGDADQLPSIGPGNVLSDLIDSGRIPVVRLDTVHRYDKTAWLYDAAPSILQGKVELRTCEGLTFLPHETEEDVQRAVVDAVLAERATSRLKVPDDVLVISPQNVGPFGTNVINEILQAKLNPVQPMSDTFSASVGKGMRQLIHVNDPVTAIRNDYKRGICNGEIGKVTQVHGRGEGSVQVLFDSEISTYTKTEAAESLRLAYCSSVHRAQGSEAKTVIFIAHLDHQHMLSRRLFYTAVTRAQKKVIIIGQREAVEHAVSNDREADRLTTLYDRMVKGAADG